MATAREVARWMKSEMQRQGELIQEDAAQEILERFGKLFTYINDNGNLAISREVLKEFRALTEKTVVWDRGQRLWRPRESTDPPGRAAE
jgi:hypothetical protein